MRQMSLIAFVGVFAMILTVSTTVVADQVYHSERLPFALTDAGLLAGHPELRSGQVVNIHPNGPVNGALERYMIKAPSQIPVIKWSSRFLATTARVTLPCRSQRQRWRQISKGMRRVKRRSADKT
jgi:hypothetical protein